VTSSLDPAFAALAGSTIGGLTTLAVTWIAQRTQLRATLAARDRTAREKLYKQFIEEASKLFGDALVSNTLEISMLIGAYALISRMRVVSLPETVEKAEVVLRAIINLYASPNRTVADLRADLNEHKLDFLRDFSSAARDELLGLRNIRA
jgi:hypothetical protein